MEDGFKTDKALAEALAKTKRRELTPRDIERLDTPEMRKFAEMLNETGEKRTIAERVKTSRAEAATQHGRN